MEISLADPIHLILIPPPILPDLNLVFVLRSPGAELMSKYGVNVPRGVAVGSTEELKKAIQEQFPKENEVCMKYFIIAYVIN
ncbi:hypothetical protein QQ045_011177 [Rhodiola kirilowii]